MRALFVQSTGTCPMFIRLVFGRSRFGLGSAWISTAYQSFNQSSCRQPMVHRSPGLLTVLHLPDESHHTEGGEMSKVQGPMFCDLRSLVLDLSQISDLRYLRSQFQISDRETLDFGLLTMDCQGWFQRPRDQHWTRRLSQNSINVGSK